MKEVFDAQYKAKYVKAGLLDSCGGELQHLISDAATMQIIRWTGVGFGMAAHNYDGDMLTDEVAQVHRSPGFITSNLIGKKDDGTMIKEFEASHGTVADLWHMHLAGKETSLNPLGLAEALIGAMNHAAVLNPDTCDKDRIFEYTTLMRRSMHECMVEGKGTRDLCGPSGLTTEGFVDEVSARIEAGLAGKTITRSKSLSKPLVHIEGVDTGKVKAMFDEYDLDSNGQISLDEFAEMLIKLGVAPKVAN